MRSCKHFGQCGGCQYLDIPYDVQLQKKQAVLHELFTEWNDKLSGTIIPSPQTTYYRHKVQLPFGISARKMMTLGCYAADSHRVIDQSCCMIQDKDLSHCAWAIREWARATRLPAYDEKTGTGYFRHVLLRKGAGTGEILIGIVTNGERPKSTRALADMLIKKVQDSLSPKARIVGIVQNVNTRKTNVVLGETEYVWWGRPFLKEKLGDLMFKVGLSTFFQINPFQTPSLYNQVLKNIPEHSRVVDLYCGVGSISLWVARKAEQVTGIEENPHSVNVAQTAARDNKIGNARFYREDAAVAIAEMNLEGHTVIVDPPRKGLDSSTLPQLKKSAANRLIYVSCNAETLSRDIRLLQPEMKVVSIQGVDMFPHTEHIECVAVLDRN